MAGPTAAPFLCTKRSGIADAPPARTCAVCPLHLSTACRTRARSTSSSRTSRAPQISVCSTQEPTPSPALPPMPRRPPLTGCRFPTLSRALSSARCWLPCPRPSAQRRWRPSGASPSFSGGSVGCVLLLGAAHAAAALAESVRGVQQPTGQLAAITRHCCQHSPMLHLLSFCRNLGFFLVHTIFLGVSQAATLIALGHLRVRSPRCDPRMQGSDAQQCACPG